MKSESWASGHTIKIWQEHFGNKYGENEKRSETGKNKNVRIILAFSGSLNKFDANYCATSIKTMHSVKY